MQDIHIPAGARTPVLRFSFGTGELLIEGESYPEDARSFFDEPMRALTEWLTSTDTPVNLDFRLIYFNSSTAKIILGILERLQAAAEHGRPCVVRWYYASDDDNIRELGEEFGSDLASVRFEMVPEEVE
jgi:hypothetical protein